MLITKVDVDESPQTARDYKVMSISTSIIFKNDKVVNDLVGYRNKAGYSND